MPPPIFPLRWESTGDQWWYASPIDCAAANGLYDVVIELLHQDTNLLVKLTSLRRIRRLETVWDDGDGDNCHVALNRSRVARRLLEECEIGNGDNSLVRAGYGGWLLYTAASAGDLEFVKKLLERDPLLVFGEGEYGVTDILYAAARGRNDDVFRLLLDFALLPADIAGVEETDGEKLTEKQLIVKQEMVKRGVHSAARGGHVAILEEFLLTGKYDAVSGLKDAYGSTLLHSASSRGQIKVVRYLVSKYNDSIVEVKDGQGNTALHIAAYKGHLAVVEALIDASPPLISVVNNEGDTFLHMVVSGFAASGFKRLDRQMELLKKLISGGGGGSWSVDLSEIVNVRNGNGRTVVHLAVMDILNTVRPDVVEILLIIPGVDLNVVDSDGMTAVDLLEGQTPKTPVSDLLIKRLKSAGGRSNAGGEKVLRFREERYGFCGSPGTSFEISDSEIFLFTAARTDHTAANAEISPERESFDGISECSTEVSTHSKRKRGGTGARLKLLLRWAKREETEENRRFSGDNSNRRVPLREMYSPSCNRGRAFPLRTESGDLPSLSVRLKFTEGLMKGVVVQESPRFVFSPPVVSDYSGALSSACSSPFQTVSSELERKTPAMKKQRSFMNRYLCFSGRGLAIDGSSEMSNGSAHRLRHRSFKRVMSLVSS
ncbi:hypothetical protein EUTSA_v10020242mg [Eutrema salsugineum]|uniref:Uncharacterized protein n=1 Tax=Eutrema salsugineum TaxID=72664 RepID=V4M430_EUTSA|nr:uncharacterized protein LOC18024925 [Eutrema salsugineum]ESQ49672.1 hypothetical protein EUTSA_v10020242mg [Eutrema salsugineum]